MDVDKSGSLKIDKGEASSLPTSAWAPGPTHLMKPIKGGLELGQSSD